MSAPVMAPAPAMAVAWWKASILTTETFDNRTVNGANHGRQESRPRR